MKVRSVDALAGIELRLPDFKAACGDQRVADKKVRKALWVIVDL